MFQNCTVWSIGHLSIVGRIIIIIIIIIIIKVKDFKVINIAGTT